MIEDNIMYIFVQENTSKRISNIIILNLNKTCIRIYYKIKIRKYL